MPLMFIPQDWYWHVAGDAANVYSSARNIYVPVSDSAYKGWLGNGLPDAQSIPSEADIWHYVQDFLPLFLWNGTTMSQPATGQYTKDQLQNYNGNLRFNKVTGGMTAAGVPVKTDDRSRGLIADARTAAVADPNFATQWYGSDGNFYPVDAATMISLGDTVAKHTNDCYVVFSQVSGGITANTITTLAPIDAAYDGL